MGKNESGSNVLWQGIIQFCLVLFLISFNTPIPAADSICALVKIEIEQTLTLERQAFDARMVITNHQDTLELQNVKVDVLFTDDQGDSVLASSDPDNTAATFFIRVDSLTNISDVSGTGTVPPNAQAEVHWLIIPAPGAGGDVASGKRYDVGAALTYTKNGVAKEVVVAPDLIFVKPLPLLNLDYFLTQDVVADNPFTPSIEPPEPFTLGVRVANNGGGVAQNLSIDTAQPRIIENEQGLLIDFRITGAQLDNQPVESALLMDFGDIVAGQSRVGRWQMETTLSGTFVEFNATFSHADDLGGRLTSLIDTINTHLLMHDVRVDLPGRDDVQDFLAQDGDVLRVYESEYLDTLVEDLSASSSLTLLADDRYQLTVPATIGMRYAGLPDPFSGTKHLVAAYRADDTRLPQENAWQSRSIGEGGVEQHQIHLFDYHPSASYTLVYGSDIPGNEPPVIQYIADQTIAVESTLSFLVEASDPNRTIPQVTASPMPSGASFVADQVNYDNSRYIFEWTPAIEQNGTYTLVFEADDGSLRSLRTVIIRVTSPEDTDGDGMPDAWEIQYFGSLAQDAFTDFDGDGISDLDEYRNGTDPTMIGVPRAPVIQMPVDGSRTLTLQPELIVRNSLHDPNASIMYTFEIYADAALSDLVISAVVAEQTEITAYTTSVVLNENQSYYWRVKACDDTNCSDWVYANFYVNTVNEAPQPFHLSLPEDATQTISTRPILSTTNSVDPDGDPLFYRFELFVDDLTGDPIAVSQDLPAGDAGTTSWQVSVLLNNLGHYVWRVWATDTRGLSTASVETFSFTVNTSNQPPPAPTITYPLDNSEIAQQAFDVAIANVVDPEGDAVSYEFELDTVDTFDGPNKQTSLPLPNGADGVTSWSLTDLVENTHYYLRVKADDGNTHSAWVMVSFFVNVVNDPPTTPVAQNPSDLAWVQTLRPVLSIIPATDPDDEILTYEYQVSGSAVDFSAALTKQIVQTAWTLENDLLDNNWYYWRVRAADSTGLQSEWSEVIAFFVNDNGQNDPPSIMLTQPADLVEQSLGVVRIEWTDDDPDSNAQISLYYHPGSIVAEAVAIATAIGEDPDNEADAYLWDITSIPPGDYYLSGRITDESGEQIVSNATGFVRVGTEQKGTLTILSDDPVVTSETGTSHQFSVVLDVQPTKKVIVPLMTSDTTEGALDQSSLKFTTIKWNEPQEVSVTGVDDFISDGDVGYEILFGPLSSKDPRYDTVVPGNRLQITNIDDDAQSAEEYILVSNYALKKQKLNEDGTGQYTYHVDWSNVSERELRDIRGVIHSNTPEITVLDNEVKLNKFAAGETARPTDTFTIEHHQDYPFSPTSVVWIFTYTITD